MTRKTASPDSRRVSGILPTALLVAGLAVAAVAAAQAPDTSGWECSSCPIPSGLYFDLDAGAGYVSEDAYRFGDLRGFDSEGVVVLGDFDLQYWAGNGDYWEAAGRDLGLESRSVVAEGGRQGRYTLGLTYEGIPRQLFGTTRTPFSGADTLTLPSDWVTAGSTARMTRLGDSLMPVRIGHDRETLGINLSFLQSARIEYKLDYRHAERDGQGIRGGSFISQSALLPEPIDYSTDEIDASISYTGERGQVTLSYYASMFNSKPLALTWDNPFAALAPGADTGRAAMPPDNQAHRLSLSGAIRLSPSTRLSASYAIGKLEQDDTFLPYTVNPLLTPNALPQASLAGEVETTKLHLRLTSRVNRRLRVRADLDVDDRDNTTPRNDYAIVESDLFASGIRRNVPYSYKRSRAGIRGDYRVDRNLTLSSGYSYREVERDFQEVAETDEDSAWFSARFNVDDGSAGGTVKFGHDERDGSGYMMPGDPMTAQNPLLRKYNLADRDRDFAQVSVSLTPVDRVDIGLGVERSEDEYDSTIVGLLDSDTSHYNVDAAVRLSDNASLSVFYGRETFESTQAGSAGFSTVDWTAAIEDEIDTFSVALRLPQFRDKVDLGVELLYSDATGRIALSRQAAPADDFPELSSELYSAQLYADWQAGDRYTVRVGYYYERLETRDWMLDGLAPDTLPSILALGAQAPGYSGSLFSLSFRYSLAGGAAAASE